MAMKINQAGLELIKRFEGLSLDAYLDPVGIWTIGYGHIDGVEEGMSITAEEAELLLLEELVQYETGVSGLARVPTNENEFSALVSFSYNVGIGALGSSTALKRLNKDDRLGAADALEWWNKATIDGELVTLPGLTRRRAAEKALFLDPISGKNQSYAGADTPLEYNTRIAAEEENQPRRDELSESRTVQGAVGTAAAGTVSAGGIAASQADPAQIGNSSLRRVVELMQNMTAEAYYLIGIVIVLLALYIIYARWDDWRNFRR